MDKIEGVGYLEYVKIHPSGKTINDAVKYPLSKTKLDYGYSYWQNEQIKVPSLHNIGITGYGVTSVCVMTALTGAGMKRL
ncbi:MAG: hypothetical protein UZ05_CHB002002438 [Chlorobi bacterium OLB5]|nr:MAG: hypothetical protein UZ05_CHB002002438 [Chlorobi bacterium OLB5]